MLCSQNPKRFVIKNNFGENTFGAITELDDRQQSAGEGVPPGARQWHQWLQWISIHATDSMPPLANSLGFINPIKSGRPLSGWHLATARFRNNR